MSRKVNTMVLDRWVAENSPQGMEKMSEATRVSMKTLHLARNGEAPKLLTTCLKIAKGLGVELDEVFPSVKRQKSA